MEEGGITLSRRRQLILKLAEQFRGDLINLSSPAIASRLAFKSSAVKILHGMYDDTNDTDSVIDKVAKQTKDEMSNTKIDRNNYHSHINSQNCSRFENDTLSDIFSKVGQKIDKSLPALLIGNSITSVMKNLAIPLQIALAVLQI